MSRYDEIAVSAGRFILVLAWCVLIPLSLLGGQALGHVMSTDDSHKCCGTGEGDRESQPVKTPCGKGQCALPCCGMVGIQPQMSHSIVHLSTVSEFAVVPSDNLHSLTEAESLFHPPRD